MNMCYYIQATFTNLWHLHSRLTLWQELGKRNPKSYLVSRCHNIVDDCVKDHNRYTPSSNGMAAVDQSLVTDFS